MLRAASCEWARHQMPFMCISTYVCWWYGDVMCEVDGNVGDECVGSSRIAKLGPTFGWLVLTLVSQTVRYLI